jgi:hypothetical protein
MEDRRESIVNEISQVLEQYRQEVPGRRKPLPESIKSRVAELHRLGCKSAEVSRRTGIPYFTVLKWARKQKAPGFDVVKVVRSRSAIVRRNATAVSVRKQRSNNVDTVTESTFPTVTIILPSGVRIKRVGLDFLIRLMPAIGGVR